MTVASFLNAFIVWSLFFMAANLGLFESSRFEFHDGSISMYTPTYQGRGGRIIERNEDQ